MCKLCVFAPHILWWHLLTAGVFHRCRMGFLYLVPFTCSLSAISMLCSEINVANLLNDVTSPHSPLTPSIFIRLQLLAIIVIAMLLSLHEKSWHVDHVPARTITHHRGLLTRVLPAHPETTKARVERLKGGGQWGMEGEVAALVRSTARVISQNA